MKVIRPHDSATCSYCKKEKKAVEVELNGKTTILCWTDFKRHIDQLAPEDKKHGSQA